MFPSKQILQWNSKPYKDVKYDSIDEEEESTSSVESEPRSQQPLVYSRIWSFAAGIATVLLFLAIFLLGHHFLAPGKPKYAPDEFPDEEWNHCGRSSIVAKERGCIMEPLFYGWFPPQCVYQELLVQFPVFEDRTWYRDFNMTIPIPSSELWEGKYDPIYVNKYHSEHCLYQWRKLLFAYHERREWIDNKTVSLGHGGHCANQLSTGIVNMGADDVNIVDLGFYRCRKTIW